MFVFPFSCKTNNQQSRENASKWKIVKGVKIINFIILQLNLVTNNAHLGFLKKQFLQFKKPTADWWTFSWLPTRKKDFKQSNSIFNWKILIKKKSLKWRMDKKIYLRLFPSHFSSLLRKRNEFHCFMSNVIKNIFSWKIYKKILYFAVFVVNDLIMDEAQEIKKSWIIFSFLRQKDNFVSEWKWKSFLRYFWENFPFLFHSLFWDTKTNWKRWRERQRGKSKQSGTINIWKQKSIFCFIALA